jgi:hypothetical protein
MIKSTAIRAFAAASVVFGLTTGLYACGGEDRGASGGSTVTTIRGSSSTSATTGGVEVTYGSDDVNQAIEGVVNARILLKGDVISVDGGGAKVDGSSVLVSSAGTYIIEGTLDDGQVIVLTEDEANVKLILNGAQINCSTGSAIYVAKSAKTVISLAEGTKNSVTDGTTYVLKDGEADQPWAAIFSMSDLTINGTGSLTVTGNYKNGIASKDELKITGGTITVDAVADGIRGRDYVAVKDGSVTVRAGADGIQSNNDEDVEKGYVSIEGGTISVQSGADGIQAETNLSISGGTVNIVSGGGAAAGASYGGGNDGGGRGQRTTTTTGTESDSAKGLKAGNSVSITAGTIDIDAADDAVHSNNVIVIAGGILALSTGDDGVHADARLQIDGGTMNLSQSYEGLESAVIVINDGDIHVVSSDDGINVAGGSDTATANGGQAVGAPGQDTFAESGNNSIDFNGGYTYVDAGGDGVDTNGTMRMTGGTLIVNGPTNSGNGAIDYGNSTFEMTGGVLVAAGSAGMAQAPSASSSQYAVLINFDSLLAQGTMVHIESSSGEAVLTFLPTKTYQSLALSSPQLKKGETYSVYVGGACTGTITDGVYSGAYSGGTLNTTFTISSMVTAVGAAARGFTGGGGGGTPGRRN